MSDHRAEQPTGGRYVSAYQSADAGGRYPPTGTDVGGLHQTVPPYADPRLDAHPHTSYRTPQSRNRARSTSANVEGEDRSFKRARIDIPPNHPSAGGPHAGGQEPIPQSHSHGWVNHGQSSASKVAHQGWELQYGSNVTQQHLGAYSTTYPPPEAGTSGPAQNLPPSSSHMVSDPQYGRYDAAPNLQSSYPALGLPNLPPTSSLLGPQQHHTPSYAYPPTTQEQAKSPLYDMPPRLTPSPHAAHYSAPGSWQQAGSAAWPPHSAPAHSIYPVSSSAPPPLARLQTAIPGSGQPTDDVPSASATSAASMALRYPSPTPTRPSMAYVPTSGPYVPPVRPYITSVRPPVALAPSGAPLKTTAVFVNKLYTMLEDPNIQGAGLLRWSDDGMGFICPDPAEFARLILPNFFRHNNWHSFCRQLNMYGFNKRVNDPFQVMNLPSDAPIPWEFRHAVFARGDPVAIASIRRRAVRPNAPSSSSGSVGAGPKPASQANSPSPAAYQNVDQVQEPRRHAGDASYTHPSYPGRPLDVHSSNHAARAASHPPPMPASVPPVAQHYPAYRQIVTVNDPSGQFDGNYSLGQYPEHDGRPATNPGHSTTQDAPEPIMSSREQPPYHGERHYPRGMVEPNWNRRPPISSTGEPYRPGPGPYEAHGALANVEQPPVAEAHHDAPLGFQQSLPQPPYQFHREEGNFQRSRRQSLEEVAEVGKATVELLARDVAVLGDQARDMVQESHAIQVHDEDAKLANEQLVAVLLDKAKDTVTQSEAADIRQRMDRIDDLTAAKEDAIGKTVLQSENVEATTQLLQQHVDTAAETVATSLAGFDSRSSFGSFAGAYPFRGDPSMSQEYNLQHRRSSLAIMNPPDLSGPHGRRASLHGGRRASMNQDYVSDGTSLGIRA